MTRRIYPSLKILVIIFATSFAVAAQCKGPVFLSASSYAADLQPFSVAVGEFNGDGKQDLAVANVGSDNVSILLGDGAGGFGPPSNIPVGRNPSAVAVGDFNKDGKADLVVGFIFFRPPSVLFGNGNATFSGPTDVGNSANTSYVAVADFNKDDNPDIAVANTGSQQILLGNGSGGFALRTISVGGDTSSVAAGDFNEDGFPDAAYTVRGVDWKVVLVFGNAAGTFSANTSFTVPQQPQAIAVGNFNGDSRPDLFVGINWFEPRVMLFTNNGGGSFTATGDVFAGRIPEAVTVGDFNGDGKLDGAAALPEANGVGIYFGDGQGHLSSPVYYGAGFTPLSIATSDFNGDSKLDLVTADSASTVLAPRKPTGVSVLLATGPGTFDSYRTYANPFGPFIMTPNRIVSGDFNSTGRPDLALTFNFSSLVGIMLDNGQGGFIEPLFLDAGATPGSIAVSDLNGDNKADVVTANTHTSNISIFFGLGNGLFMPRVQIAANLSPKLVLPGDFNGDGKRDLIVTHDSTANAIILLGDGVGGFVPTSGAPQPALKEIAVGDLNGDGRTDVVATDFPQHNVSTFLSDVTGHLNLAVTTPMLSIFTLTRLHVADLNSDNKQDVVVANTDRNNITVWLGDGAGGLSAGTNYDSAEPRPFELSTADFDADGKLDLAVTHSGGQTIALYSGDNSGQLNSPDLYPAGLNPNELKAGDFNQDTKLDLAVLSSFGYGVSILQNIKGPLPCLSVNDVSITEGDSGSVNLDFVISLSQSSLQTIRVNYSLVNGTATKGADFTAIADRLVFAPGETTKTVSVPVLGDVLNEVNEVFKLQLASPTNAAIGDGEGQGTILDNDPIPTISINDISNVESFFAGSFTVSLSAVSGRAVTVKYATANGTAVSGDSNTGDFFAASGTLTIPAGQLSGQIHVQTFDDAMFEPDETFFLNLSDPTAATLNDAQAQGTIVNNDPIPTIFVPDAFINEGNSGTTQAEFFIRLSNPTWLPVTLNYATSDDSAVAGTDYVATSGSLTFAPGESEKSVIALVNGDTVDEVLKQFFLNISNVQNATVPLNRASGVIIDDDGPTVSVNDISVTEGNSGLKAATFTLTLSAPSVQAINVRATLSAGTASPFFDYNSFSSTFTIPAGTTTRTFNVAIVGDTTPEPDETFNVNLSNPFNATIDDEHGIGTILDDDTLRLIRDESGPDSLQATAFDSVLLLRDPFRVQNIAGWWLNLFPDPNTRVMLFAQNLQLNQGETPSAVIVNLLDANNQSFDVPAEDVRTAPNSSFTQVVFRLPNGLAAGSCKVTIKAHSQTSNIGTIRIAP